MKQLIMKDIFSKKLAIEFTEENVTSDSGLVLFKPTIDNLNIVKRIEKILHDPRNPKAIDHSTNEMISQRLYQLIAGYNDLNDADSLRNDILFKELCKKKNEELASSPTLCRLENRVTFAEDIQLTQLQVELYLQRNHKRFKKQLKKKGYISIKLDLDPTNITTYGQQQLALFNGYYKETCYLPLIIADGDNSDLVCGILRPGTKHATYLLVPILKRIFAMIEEKYCKVHYHIRADSGFQSDAFFSFLESKDNLVYEIALATNNNLSKATQNYYYDSAIYFEETEKTLKIYNEFGYRAKSWSKYRRVVYKLEINQHGNNVRYIVTNRTNTPKVIINSYHQRSEIENRIKEIKSQTGADRLSSENFRTNYFRLCLSCFAFIVFQEFKKKLTSTGLLNSYVQTIREKIIKVAGTIISSTRRFVLKLPKHYPYQYLWTQLIHG